MSGGFNFGTGTGQQNVSQPAQNLGFGGAAPPTLGSFAAVAGQQQTPSLFGNQQQQLAPPVASFGAPANPTTSTFGFGTAQPATGFSGFGTGAPPAFGTTTTASSFNFAGATPAQPPLPFLIQQQLQANAFTNQQQPQGTGYGNPLQLQPQGTGYGNLLQQQPQGTGCGNMLQQQPQGPGFGNLLQQQSQGTGFGNLLQQPWTGVPWNQQPQIPTPGIGNQQQLQVPGINNQQEQPSSFSNPLQQQSQLQMYGNQPQQLQTGFQQTQLQTLGISNQQQVQSLGGTNQQQLTTLGIANQQQVTNFGITNQQQVPFLGITNQQQALGLGSQGQQIMHHQLQQPVAQQQQPETPINQMIPVGTTYNKTKKHRNEHRQPYCSINVQERQAPGTVNQQEQKQQNPTTCTNRQFLRPTPPSQQAPQFGFPASTAPPPFGTQSQPITSNGTTGFGLGTLPQTSSTLNFGSTFTTQQQTAPPNFVFGGTTAPASTSLSFGGTPTSVPSSGLNFGGLAPSTSGTPFPLFGTSQSGLSGTADATTVGLGGISTLPQASIGLSGGLSNAKPDGKSLKEILLPVEIFQTIEEFKKHTKHQQTITSGISHWSSNALYKVQEETVSLRHLVTTLANDLQRNIITIQRIKRDTAKELRHTDMAQRLKDMSPPYHGDTTAPNDYFIQLAREFENQMLLFRREIETAERNVLSLGQPSSLSPDELAHVMRQLHESLVVLAGRLQSIHEGVMQLKEQYVTYRKRVLGESSEIFRKRLDNRDDEVVRERQQTVLMGPSPFTGHPLINNTLNAPTTIGSGFPTSLNNAGLSFGGNRPLGN